MEIFLYKKQRILSGTTVDFSLFSVYNDHVFSIAFQCRQALEAAAENREPGANPGRYRHCKRGGTAQDIVSHWAYAREGVQLPAMRKSGDLLKCVFCLISLDAGEIGNLLCGKTTAAVLWTAAVFSFFRDDCAVSPDFMPTSAKCTKSLLSGPRPGIFSAYAGK